MRAEFVLEEQAEMQIRCLHCGEQTGIQGIKMEPVLKGDGEFVTRWYLVATTRCKCRNMETTRAIAYVEPEGTG